MRHSLAVTILLGPLLSSAVFQPSSGPNPDGYTVPFQIGPRTPQQQQNAFQRRLINANAFLPGLGSFAGKTRRQRSQSSSVAAELNGTPAQHAKTPALDSSASSAQSNPFLFSTVSDDDGASAPERTVVMTGPPPVKAGSKCSYVQLKGGPMAGADCHKGGMACEKQCSLGAGEEVSCRTVDEEECREVPSQQCNTVMESVCEPVAETVCSEDQEVEPQTK